MVGSRKSFHGFSEFCTEANAQSYTFSTCFNGSRHLESLLFNDDLINAYSVPSKVLGARNVSINKIDMISVLMKSVF